MNNSNQNQLDRIVLGVFTVLAVSLIYNTIDAIYRNYQLQGRVELLTQEIEVLELENSNLKSRILFYETDAYQDLALRERGNVASPGEKVVLFQKDIRPNFESETTETKQTPENDKSNFSKWLDFFSGA